MAVSPGLSPTDIPASENAGIPARFAMQLKSAHPDGSKQVAARVVGHPAAHVVAAELREFSGFETNFALVAQRLITSFVEEKGAPTKKIAASLALKSSCQAILNRISVTYLLTGRAPRLDELRFVLHDTAPWVELFYDPRLTLENFELNPDQGPAELFALSICFEEVIAVFHRELGRRKVPPSVFYSTVAISIISPLLVLRRHGAKPAEVASLMRAYLASLGKKINGGIIWRQRQHEGLVEYAPRRKACCLKYALPHKPHLCSTCSRSTQTTFFDEFQGPVGGHMLKDGR
ncbi:hypothetical protein PsAD2_02544 [Pseudovibrio axinellae]|uniref:Ferric siderophore reductase C-terminal domain-containing protein n=1 Tax=Pseudovibrio axinellae TaxID=989403 RepID=A0A165YNX2_9HYPH|nr:hypothetical protein [Pseudovibrio axinellae]KZL19025.1 hypothetical protein PsAD2_02544 [Pseudovibrio axinellae]SEP83390.1 hypothetical protein SAMN05421798_101497 [Pseudovibrio axinellae]